MEDNMQNDQEDQKKKLCLDIKTWNSKSFNYKDTNFEPKFDEIDESYFYYCSGTKHCIDKTKFQHLIDNSSGDYILFRVRKSTKEKNKYEIINPIQKDMKKTKNNIQKLKNNGGWLVVRNENTEIGFFGNENEDYILNVNDIIKFGGKMYEIIRMNINNSEKNIIKVNNLENNISQINKKKGSVFNIDIEAYQYKNELMNKSTEKNKNSINEKINNNSIINKNIINNNESLSDSYSTEYNADSNEIEKCRICYGIESTKENPMIKICSCKDYFHFKCLKIYIKTKTEIHENSRFTVKTYICQKFNCEVCLEPYPLRFRIKEYNKIYELIDFDLPQELDYIILESLDYIENDKNYKIIHVVQLERDKISIGRNLMNDIIDPFLSVSREHAVLNYNKEKGNITIKNRSQKFGTLVLIKGNIKMTKKKIGFQVGKSYITAYLAEKNEGEN